MARYWRSGSVVVLAVLIALAGRSACGDERPSTQDWLKQRLAEFREYRFTREGAKPVELAMEPRSLLNWSNAERGTGEGGLFLWTDEGEPQMIACAFELGGSVKHEFHSLSTSAIAAVRRGEAVHRFGPGIEWIEWAEGPKRARTPTLRLTQMRRQAERFRVTVGHQDWAETRLLPQPVFRSPDSAEGDAAVFVFVQGTDPECVLLLESSPEGTWRYALTRQTKFGLKAELDGRLVREWSPKHRPETVPQTPFLVLVQQPPAPPSAGDSR